MSKQPRPRGQQLRDTLEEEIVNGRLKPGERLDELALAERFQVSRTPIREALRQLAATKLVEIIPKRGAYVATIELPQLVEMFEVMAEFEAMCARLCVRRMTNQDLDDLQEALEACRVAAAEGDADAYYYENERFHHVLYRGSHNAYLFEQARQLHMRLQPYRRLQLHVRNRVRGSFAEHEGIVQAILDGDQSLAETRARAHVTIQGERFADFVASVSSATASSMRDRSSSALENPA